jgi:universal stress protein A
MNIERILVPTDFSDCSDQALEFASRLADQSGAVLLILHVEEHPNGEGKEGEQRPAGTRASRQEVQERLRHIRPTIPRVTYQIEHATGSPVAEILKIAERDEVDAIVIGSHGRTGLVKLLTGSVAEGVIRGATCPVLIVKSPLSAVEDVSAAVLDAPPG